MYADTGLPTAQNCHSQRQPVNGYAAQNKPLLQNETNFNKHIYLDLFQHNHENK